MSDAIGSISTSHPISAAGQTSGEEAGAPRPWGAIFAWLLVGGFLLVQLPAYLCMGLHADVCMYDVCAQNILRGGVHYRDALEPNFPGIVWLHLLFRTLGGWSFPTLRAVDLAIVCANVWLLVRWLPAPPWGVARAALAGVLLAFWLGTSEWCQAQRDGWMLLPALAALQMRREQVLRVSRLAPSAASIAALAGLEGMLWAAACWIKPFVAIPAAVSWLVGLSLMPRSRPGVGRLLLVDFTAFLAGGVAVGAAGTVWLVTSGAWPAFVEIMFGWNAEYIRFDVTVGHRGLNALGIALRFFPWICVHLPAVPLALQQVYLAARARTAESPPAPGTLLAGFYLAWLLQVLLLQHPFDYVHAPAIGIGLTVLACSIRAQPSPLLRVLGCTFFFFCLLTRVPNLLAERVALIDRCVTEGGTPELRDRLSWLHQVQWTDLQRVNDFLLAQHVGDGEVTCFSLTVVSVYRDLDLRPSTRYLFLHDHLLIYKSRHERIWEELSASHQRYVVCDLSRFGHDALRRSLDDEGATTSLETDRVVFRAGNYVVLRIDPSEMRAWVSRYFVF